MVRFDAFESGGVALLFGKGGHGEGIMILESIVIRSKIRSVEGATTRFRRELRVF
jgi:hypothetical protein